MHSEKATESHTVQMGTICWVQLTKNVNECSNMSTVFPSACLASKLNTF